MSQYYEVLNQGEKPSDTQFYTNVEDQTVQYVITPDKTQVQFPTQQVQQVQAPQAVMQQQMPQHTQLQQAQVVQQGQLQGQMQQPQTQMPQEIQTQRQQQAQMQHVQIQQHSSMQQQQSQQQNLSPQNQAPTQQQGGVQQQQSPAPQQQTQVLQPQQQQVQLQQQQVQVQGLQGHQFAVIHDNRMGGGTQQIFLMGTTSNASMVEQANQQQQQPIVLNHQLGQGNAIVRPASRIGAMVQGVRAAMRQPLIQQSPRPQQSRPQQMRSPGSVQGMQSPRVGQAVRQVTPGQQAKQVRPVMQRPQQFRAVLGGVPRGSPVGQIVGQTVGGQQRFRTGMIQQRSPTQMQRPGPPNQRFQTMQQVQQQSQQQLQMQQQAQVQQQGQIQQQDQIQQQQVQQQQTSSPDVEEMETNSNEEQEAVTLPDGNVVTVSTYKKMLAEQKARALNQNRQPLLGQPQQQQQLMSSLQTNGSPASLTPNAAKKRPPAPRTPRTSARGGPRTPAKRMQAQMHAQYMMGQPQQQQQQMQNHQQQQQIIANQQMRPSQANYIIQPPKPNQKPQQQRPLPAYIPSSQIQKIIESTAMTEEFSDSIRMLVLLENGEQRLITFTLPKEACTILEILEQVNVPFQAETNIQVTEANSNGINYIVTVGNVLPLRYQEEEESEQPPQGQPDQSVGTQDASSSSAVEPLQPPPAPPSSLQQMPPPHAPAPLQQPAAVSEQPSTPPKTPSPEPAKEVPKFVPGMLALCGACGYLSEDFNKCIRCNRKLPDNVKAIPATLRPSGSAGLGHKKEQPVPQLSQPPPPTPVNPVLQQNKPHITIKTISGGVKKKANKKSVEQESVVISSDEEEEDKPNVADNIIQKLGASVTICPVTKEPSSNEIIRHNSLRRTSSEELDENDFGISMKFRTIRIGSYRCIPAEKVSINAIRILLKVPHPSNDKDIKTLVFERENVVKVLASFNSSLPVLFLYVNPILAQKIRTELDMTADGDYYFDPISSQDESFRRVTFLPDDITEDEQKVIQTIFGPPNNILDELNIKEANDILIKTCPKDVTRTALGIGAFTEIKQLLTYPPEGRGRMSISTEDYLCLAQDQFLNDVIIDFYLKYLVENLPEEKRCKVHVFSTFFYNRLTTKPAKASRKSQPTELDPTLSPAQKRHARVKTWTKKVNLFEKDFIIVPINENAHWFLAIICFPGMDGCQTWDGKPIKIEVKKRTKKNPAAAGPSTPTATVKQDKTASAEKAILCDDGASSDKDEAEGDESDLESDESRAPSPTGSTSSGGVTGTAAPSPATVVTTPTTNTSTKKEPRPPIKQPCILIFDSLAGASRNRVVATLRDYLTCEYKAKMGTDRIYNRDIIKGANPKVPQQNNFTDCGLYVLQYVEQFFKDPIKDYHMPIKQIQNWFEEITVTKKREDIAILIRTLMREYGKDVRILPDITFPTLNGKLVERSFEDEEDEEMEEEATAEEEEEADEDSLTSKDESSIKQDPAKEESERGSSAVDMGDQESSSPIKPSSLAPSSDFAVQPVLNPKPDISEFPRQTNKDTLSILKAKRIVKNKNPGPSLKKQKIDE
ncbi:unnamed protein product [Acanthoscelides obtectus]|uniref:Ubiquitin-like protease family profile domain-containing protein n=2 Tax=Acanthoscelides obtectus TaxID=200917 RepID=A0A9P0JJW5_ACAOB|nr:unnamed protein product [Acanthoscelides obtectus]CAK1661555.1 Sentrin-specific protease 7 [Acanthoscelides obtectus]